MKIKIVTEHPNLKNIPGTFTEDELKYIKILEEDENLERDLRSARERCNLPPEGCNIDKPISKYNRQEVFNKIDWNQLIYNSYRFSLMFGLPTPLPEYWRQFFSNLILFNIALPMDKSQYLPVEIKANEKEVTIIIREKTSKRALKKYIDDSDTLDHLLTTLPVTPTIGISLKGLGIKKRIMELKEVGKTDREIGEILSEEYEDLPFNPDYEIIAVERTRYKNCLDRLLSSRRTLLDAIGKSMLR